MEPFPISNFEIIQENDNKKRDIIDLELIVDPLGNVETEINYNNYNPKSMLVFENKIFCKIFI